MQDEFVNYILTTAPPRKNGLNFNVWI